MLNIQISDNNFIFNDTTYNFGQDFLERSNINLNQVTNIIECIIDIDKLFITDIKITCQNKIIQLSLLNHIYNIEIISNNSIDIKTTQLIKTMSINTNKILFINQDLSVETFTVYAKSVNINSIVNTEELIGKVNSFYLNKNLSVNNYKCTINNLKIDTKAEFSIKNNQKSQYTIDSLINNGIISARIDSFSNIEAESFVNTELTIEGRLFKNNGEIHSNNLYLNYDDFELDNGKIITDNFYVQTNNFNAKNTSTIQAINNIKLYTKNSLILKSKIIANYLHCNSNYGNCEFKIEESNNIFKKIKLQNYNNVILGSLIRTEDFLCNAKNILTNDECMIISDNCKLISNNNMSNIMLYPLNSPLNNTNYIKNILQCLEKINMIAKSLNIDIKINFIKLDLALMIFKDILKCMNKQITIEKLLINSLLNIVENYDETITILIQFAETVYLELSESNELNIYNLIKLIFFTTSQIIYSKKLNFSKETLNFIINYTWAAKYIINIWNDSSMLYALYYEQENIKKLNILLKVIIKYISLEKMRNISSLAANKSGFFQSELNNNIDEWLNIIDIITSSDLSDYFIIFKLLCKIIGTCQSTKCILDAKDIIIENIKNNERIDFYKICDNSNTKFSNINLSNIKFISNNIFFIYNSINFLRSFASHESYFNDILIKADYIYSRGCHYANSYVLFASNMVHNCETVIQSRNTRYIEHLNLSGCEFFFNKSGNIIKHQYGHGSTASLPNNYVYLDLSNIKITMDNDIYLDDSLYQVLPNHINNNLYLHYNNNSRNYNELNLQGNSQYSVHHIFNQDLEEYNFSDQNNLNTEIIAPNKKLTLNGKSNPEHKRMITISGPDIIISYGDFENIRLKVFNATFNNYANRINMLAIYNGTLVNMTQSHIYDLILEDSTYNQTNYKGLFIENLYGNNSNIEISPNVNINPNSINVRNANLNNTNILINNGSFNIEKAYINGGNIEIRSIQKIYNTKEFTTSTLNISEGILNLDYFKLYGGNLLSTEKLIINTNNDIIIDSVNSVISSYLMSYSYSVLPSILGNSITFNAKQSAILKSANIVCQDITFAGQQLTELSNEMSRISFLNGKVNYLQPIENIIFSDKIIIGGTYSNTIINDTSFSPLNNNNNNILSIKGENIAICSNATTFDSKYYYKYFNINGVDLTGMNKITTEIDSNLFNFKQVIYDARNINKKNLENFFSQVNSIKNINTNISKNKIFTISHANVLIGDLDATNFCELNDINIISENISINGKTVVIQSSLNTENNLCFDFSFEDFSIGCFIVNEKNNYYNCNSLKCSDLMQLNANTSYLENTCIDAENISLSQDNLTINTRNNVQQTIKSGLFINLAGPGINYYKTNYDKALSTCLKANSSFDIEADILEIFGGVQIENPNIQPLTLEKTQINGLAITESIDKKDFSITKYYAHIMYQDNRNEIIPLILDAKGNFSINNTAIHPRNSTKNIIDRDHNIIIPLFFVFNIGPFKKSFNSTQSNIPIRNPYTLPITENNLQPLIVNLTKKHIHDKLMSSFKSIDLKNNMLKNMNYHQNSFHIQAKNYFYSKNSTIPLLVMFHIASLHPAIKTVKIISSMIKNVRNYKKILSFLSRKNKNFNQKSLNAAL